MIKIRRGTFETNSSSTHSIVIPRKKEPILSTENDLFVFDTGWYQWRFNKYDFANYLWTAILLFNRYYEDCNTYYIDYWSKKEFKLHSVDEWKNKIRKILSPYYTNIIFKMPEIEYYGEKNWDYLDCSIDHVDRTIELLDKLYNDEKLLLNSILYGKVFTGNDNSYDYERIYDEEIGKYEADNENYFVYYKGN